MLDREQRKPQSSSLLSIYNNISSLQEFVERSNDFFDC